MDDKILDQNAREMLLVLKSVQNDLRQFAENNPKATDDNNDFKSAINGLKELSGHIRCLTDPFTSNEPTPASPVTNNRQWLKIQ